MPTPAEPCFEDDASGEAWFQKGVTLLEGRKQEREIEEKLRRRMKRSVMYEVQFWVGMMWVLFLFFGTDKTLGFLATVSAVIAFACAIDGAAAKRTQAMLEGLNTRRAKAERRGRTCCSLLRRLMARRDTCAAAVLRQRRCNFREKIVF